MKREEIKEIVEQIIGLVNDRDFEGTKTLLDQILDDDVAATAVRFDDYGTFRYSGKENVIRVVKRSWFENPTVLKMKYLIIDEEQQIFSYITNNISNEKFTGIMLDEPLEREVVYVYQMQNDKIVNIEIFQDSFKIMQDLGKVVQNRSEKEVVRSYLRNIIEKGLNI